jgi:transposase
MRVIRPYRKFDDAFVQDAVALVSRSDRSFRDIAESLGVSVYTLRAWYNEHVAKTKKPKAKAAGRRREVPAVITEAETLEATNARLERENAALRKQVENLETDRAILKKAAAFFAKESE